MRAELIADIGNADISTELDAAQSAGMRTTQLLRDATVPHSAHAAATQFDDIRLD